MVISHQYHARYPNGRYKAITCDAGVRYCYRVLRVIDGDTVLAQLHVASDMYITERLRLRGLNAMELETDLGQKAKRALIKLLNGTIELTVYTYGNDRYGRYVADLVTDTGIYINEQLVKTGHARYLAMN